MSLLLVNTKDQSIDFHISYPAWSTTLNFASRNGWIPEGVGPPIWVDADNGEAELNDFSFLGYDSNDGQVVKETDANKLAEALERGLKYIPNVNIKSVKSFQQIGIEDNANPLEHLNETFDELIAKISDPGNPMVYFSGGEGRSFLKELIAFLQRGEFFILWFICETINIIKIII